MTINLVPLTFPASVDKKKFVEFGREVKGVHPGNLSADEFKALEEALYKSTISFCFEMLTCLLKSNWPLLR